MRKSITIAVVAFVAGAVSTWTFNHGGANAGDKVIGLVQTIDTTALTTQAGDMPTQQFDAV